MDLSYNHIGDGSKPHALPIIQGRHADLKCINATTLVKLLDNCFCDTIDSFTIVDCRYPYEYEGGHIIGSVNIYTKDDIQREFIDPFTTFSMSQSSDSSTFHPSIANSDSNSRHVLIFHCEFSSERAPKLLRHLRNKDRDINRDHYPRLMHPELYLLEGGYKAFYGQYKQYCEPQSYRPMGCKEHTEDLRVYKSMNRSRKRLKRC